MKMNNFKGCSVCKPGEERYEIYEDYNGIKRCHYDYRTMSGKLFSVVSNDLDSARKQREEWIKTLIIAERAERKNVVNNCKHDPLTAKDYPLGQYHCPECGEMVIAGMTHPKYED